MQRWALGMILAFIGCFASGIGLVLMKHSTAVEEELPLFRRKFWMAGFFFLIVNASVIDMLAFSLAPISLIAPMTGITIVVTSWLASTGILFVKETIDVYDMTSTAITLAGVLVTSVYGPHIDDKLANSETLYSYFFRTNFLTCITLLLLLLAVGWVAEGLQASRPATKPATGRVLAARILLYAYTAALSGAMSMLLLKVIGTGVFASVEFDENLLTRGWVLSLMGLGACAAVQLGFLNQTLANSPVSYGVPTYQALLTVITIITGGIFFTEFEAMEQFDQLIFACGVGITLLGLGLHSTHRSEMQIHDQRESLINDAAPGPSVPASRTDSVVDATIEVGARSGEEQGGPLRSEPTCTCAGSVASPEYSCGGRRVPSERSRLLGSSPM